MEVMKNSPLVMKKVTVGIKVYIYIENLGTFWALYFKGKYIIS